MTADNLTKRTGVVHNGATAEYPFRERCHITEWWNSPEDEQASIARARVEVGVTTRRHRLRGITERYVILQGKGIVEVDGLPAEEVEPGDVVVIPSGIPQRIGNTGPDDLVFLAICTPRFMPHLYEDLEGEHP